MSDRDERKRRGIERTANDLYREASPNTPGLTREACVKRVRQAVVGADRKER